MGKLRHLDTHTMWVQQAVRSRRLQLKKVLGEENPADLLTKHSLSKERILKLTSLYDCHFRDGRAESAPLTRTVAWDKVTPASAKQGLNSVSREGSEQDRTLEPVGSSGGVGEPTMPHNDLDSHELDSHELDRRKLDSYELDADFPI